MKVLKKVLEESLDTDKAEWTEFENRKHALHETVVDWEIDAWKHLAPDGLILDGFRQCGYFDFDGRIDRLYSKLRDTIKNREVPYDLVKKVNAVIDEMK